MPCGCWLISRQKPIGCWIEEIVLSLDSHLIYYKTRSLCQYVLYFFVSCLSCLNFKRWRKVAKLRRLSLWFKSLISRKNFVQELAFRLRLFPHNCKTFKLFTNVDWNKPLFKLLYVTLLCNTCLKFATLQTFQCENFRDFMAIQSYNRNVANFGCLRGWSLASDRRKTFRLYIAERYQEK